MKIFGLEIGRQKVVEKAAVAPMTKLDFYGPPREGFAGAWQRGITEVDREQQLAFSAVNACVTRISEDISVLPLMLRQRDFRGVLVERAESPFAAVLRKPNRYQNRIQFIGAWVTSLLLHGNTYVLKERDQNGVVVAMHVLDARRVRPMVTPDGAVYYSLSVDDLVGVDVNTTVPAREIIHDRLTTLHHPLVGVSRIYACGLAATQGIRIQANSAKFFENMSRPSGILSAPGAIAEDNADRLKKHWEENFAGGNIGRIAILGDGLKYEAMTIAAVDAQLIEQLKWTVEDVSRAFHMPLHKIGAGPMPTFNNISSMSQDYLDSTLLRLIEGIELCLEEGLNLPSGFKVDFDVDQMLRMDPLARVEMLAKAVAAGYLAPNEARFSENLPPVLGGDAPFLQQQYWPLSQLSGRPVPDSGKASSLILDRSFRDSRLVTHR